MAKASREKGKRGERELAQAYSAAGFSCQRALGQERDGGADLTLIEVAGLVLVNEAKRRERLDIPGWWRQVVEAAEGVGEPVLGFRRNRESWKVTVELDLWLRVLGRLAELEREQATEGGS